MASKKDVRGISPSALPALAAYEWPGNVRELENMIERSVALATHPVIQLEDLPLELAMQGTKPAPAAARTDNRSGQAPPAWYRLPATSTLSFS